MSKKSIILKIISAFMATVVLLSVTACAGEKTEKNEQNPYEKKVNIQINLKGGQNIKAELYPDVAPITVENFLKLVSENFYDGLIFHRVIAGFMIQGGGYAEVFYSGIANEKEAEQIEGEFSANGVRNILKHERGVLSMARTTDPNSASSQFFIMHRDAPHLDGEYAAFGKVTEGIEVVDEIATSQTTAFPVQIMQGEMKYNQTMEDVPKEPIVIESIEVIY